MFQGLQIALPLFCWPLRFTTLQGIPAVWLSLRQGRAGTACPVLIHKVDRDVYASVQQTGICLQRFVPGMYTGVGLDTASVHPNPNATPLVL